MRRRQFTLVPNTISNDTVECLEQLFERARRGEVLGIAYAVMLKGRHFVVDTAGEATRNPSFSRGMLRALDDELGRRVWND